MSSASRHHRPSSMATEKDESLVRLGKAELGRHAFETRMPKRIVRLLERESPRNKCTGLIGRLAATLERDPQLDRAYLCDGSAVHVSKRRGEGSHFCAYRNIQMLLPHPHPIHSIPELQRMIEAAWADGYNPYGAIETGGIQGTRKHIGTAEAEALFLSLGVACKAVITTTQPAWRELLDEVETYFATPPLGPPSGRDKVCRTRRSPVFLQRPNHSLTIVGIERSRNGARRLLVFDPAYPTPMWLKTKRPSSQSSSIPRFFMHRYVRDETHLSKFDAFEMLLVTNEAPVSTS